MLAAALSGEEERARRSSHRPTSPSARPQTDRGPRDAAPSLAPPRGGAAERRAAPPAQGPPRGPAAPRPVCPAPAAGGLCPAYPPGMGSAVGRRCRAASRLSSAPTPASSVSVSAASSPAPASSAALVVSAASFSRRLGSLVRAAGPPPAVPDTFPAGPAAAPLPLHGRAAASSAPPGPPPVPAYSRKGDARGGRQREMAARGPRPQQLPLPALRCAAPRPALPCPVPLCPRRAGGRRRGRVRRVGSWNGFALQVRVRQCRWRSAGCAAAPPHASQSWCMKTALEVV